MLRKTYLTLILTAVCSLSFAQPPEYSSSEVLQRLKKLNVLGSVLYVAAHPDDENTSVISYYANEELFRTAYLSATRGDGGQNLIGPEIREQLGIIRTQELLSARRTDKGQQFFSRANDFGYSKDPDETFNMWDQKEILSDFVWVIRKFRPDVIITRFNIAPGSTHGHHTASAMLAKEAFRLSGDRNAFPDQLKWVDTWQPKRLYWNTSIWFYRNREEMDTTGWARVNVGKYNPVIGATYSEISAKSRSMHKSQGFGATGRRGDDIEYFEQWDGDPSKDPMGGIETSWKRVKGGDEIEKIVQKAIDNFNSNNPSEILPILLEARNRISGLENGFWKDIKTREINELIILITGTYLELVSEDFAYSPSDSIGISLEAINRSNASIKISSVTFPGLGKKLDLKKNLVNNERLNEKWNFKLPSDIPFSHPYWLEKPGTIGRYQVDNKQLIGKPENDPALTGIIQLMVEGQSIDITLPVVYKTNDPVDGEVYRPLEIQPKVMVNMSDQALVFANGASKSVDVRVIAGGNDLKGNLTLQVPKGWEVKPVRQSFELKSKGQEQVYSFEIIPPGGSSEGTISAQAIVDGKTYTRGRSVLDYDHIRTQTIYPYTNVRVAKLDIQRIGSKVAYIMGAGDEVPEGLRQIGYDVTILQKDDVTTSNLAQYKAVILGVRAFNTVDWLSFKNEILFEYVKEGGTCIVQYQTSRGLITDRIAPVDLKLGRDRVAVEEAEVRMVMPEHPVLNVPNKITSKDFEGWVQERGLYFASEWSDAFTPILSSNDPGESAKEGGLLVAPYGKGYYVYTGYSWFRELPAGVSGAYRIFANLISLTNDGTN